MPSPNPPPRAPLADARLARLPVAGLEALAGLRDRADVFVRIVEAVAWVAWEPADGGRDPVREALLPVPGVHFFIREGEHWRPVGRRLPAFDAAATDLGPGALPLHRVLLPGPIRWEWPRGEPRPARLGLARDDRPRRASALRVAATALGPWADRAPSARLEAVRAARSGDRVLLVGRRLPALPGADRYWGHRVLVPLGLRVAPALPEQLLAEALDLPDGATALIGPDLAVEVVPPGVLTTLTRASARSMAGSGRGPGR